jgi:flagellar hook-basal body complex protein FliE
MNIDQISSINGVQPLENKAASSDVDVFNKLWDIIGTLNTNQQIANQKQQDVMLGKSDDAHGMLIALEKNELDMSYATLIRDKAIDGFKRIIDMQL